MLLEPFQSNSPCLRLHIPNITQGIGFLGNPFGSELTASAYSTSRPDVRVMGAGYFVPSRHWLEPLE
ncbi:MAG: hypothetical protein MJA27_20135 [Pseudanabaenales cyanobacterium]|nr:hypothetical protein [Pseudanabaenales cyanobacterium]